MDEPGRNHWHMTLWLRLAFVLIIGVGASLAWVLSRTGRSPVRILLVTPPQGAASGLDASECRAIGTLVQDHLDYFGSFAVTSVLEVPTDMGPLKARRHSRILVLEPRREGNRLTLAFRIAGSCSIRSGKGLNWVRTETPALPPAEAFEAFDRALGLYPKGLAGVLTPKDPSRFWDLIQATALRLQNDDLDRAANLAEAVVRAEPGCATGWVLLGNLRYRRLLDNPAAFRKDQAEAEALLRKGLALAPGHPRGTFLLSLMKSDSGNQREALEILTRARRTQRNSPALLAGLAYAARGAGLLPLARRAMEQRDSLAFSEYLSQGVDITCLYTGELPRFEASLQDRPGHLRNTTGVLPFYRGYLALVRGDRTKAHEEFNTAKLMPHGYLNIVRLSEIFALILDGRKQEAWGKLREFDQDRVGMREPDGEFTIRLAEAYALTGDHASAMEMSTRAFARGFGCTAWYERSPMLQPLRGLPKWQALLQHLKERQALMDEAFPASLVETPD